MTKQILLGQIEQELSQIQELIAQVKMLLELIARCVKTRIFKKD